MRHLVVAAAVALALPLSARAQPVSEATGPDTYLQLHLGAYLPTGDLSSLDVGYTVGGVFGARFERHLAVEAGVTFDHATSSGPGKVTFSDLPISVSVVGRLPFKRAELALYAGPDLHLARLSGQGLTGSSDTSFGGHLGARAAFNLWPTTLVGLDACATMASARLGGGATRIDAVRLAATLQYRF